MTKEEQLQTMLREVKHGLSLPQKVLPSKFFYDEKGSQLFDQITELEEYYPTRMERTILDDHVDEIGDYLGEQVLLIELGSGSSDKTRILLSNLDNISTYIPVDISGEYLFKVGEMLQHEYPQIKIIPLQADYMQSFELPEINDTDRKVVFFPGSTIGNFRRETVNRFLSVVADIAGPDGGFLIGVDLKKEIPVMEAAYNDKKGVTAAFNRNMLHHLNQSLDSNFDPDAFKHKAIWNENVGRIEMHLFSLKDQKARVDGEVISFKKGESIHTENSHKYTLQGFQEIVAPWFTVKKVWTDDNNWFSLQYLETR